MLFVVIQLIKILLKHTLYEENLIENSKKMGDYFLSKLVNLKASYPSLVKDIRGRGLMLAAFTENAELTNSIIMRCKDQGLILFWLLFEPKAICCSV